jgi:hypothetical protein
MHLLRKLAVLASGTALAAGIGISYASAASASPTAEHLCLSDPNTGIIYCANEVGNSDPVTLGGTGSSWYYPDPGQRTIKADGTDQCMQVDTTGTIYGLSDVVVTHTCNTTSKAQEFTDIGTGGTYVFESELGGCLAYNSAGPGVIYLTLCASNPTPWYEKFAAAPG